MRGDERESLRWGLVGTGDIAEKRVAPALRDVPRSSLVAVARRKAELAESFARRFGAGRWFSDWRDLVRDPEVDAVYVATPVDLHADITVAAAEAGKHVLCEKPMALTVAECDRMIAAAEAAGVMLGVAYYRHLYPVVLRVKELVEQGAIGRPVVAQINAFERFDPPADHPRAWMLDPRFSGGGPMFDFGCHRLEILLHLLGAPVGAVGMTSRAVFDRPVEDTAAAVVKFSGGALGTVTVTHGSSEPEDTLAVYGEKGSIHVPVLNAGSLTVVRGGERSIERHDPPANLHQPLVEQFVNAAFAGGHPIVDGAVGREVNRLLEAAYATFDGLPRTTG
jgi:predicted dehydrogenase